MAQFIHKNYPLNTPNDADFLKLKLFIGAPPAARSFPLTADKKWIEDPLVIIFWRHSAGLADPSISEVNRLTKLRCNLRHDDALVLRFGVMAKVNEKTKLKPASFQVIENLSAMLVNEPTDSL